MPRNKEDEEDIEIPDEDDENEGDGAPKKKREKKRKSKEEKIAERKVIFWTLLIVSLITLCFWFMPKIGSIFKGDFVWTENKTEQKVNNKVEKSSSKNYVEIRL